jgi:YjjG family noncanonical pyrimidine nucleotidase
LKKYKSIFFDLDHTLWDFERNASETIRELHTDFDLESKGVIDVNYFIANYIKFNALLWAEFRDGLVDQETLRLRRFYSTFQVYGLSDPKLIKAFSKSYMEKCPEKGHLFPHAIEVLDYLQTKYSLHIITNGFKEVQKRKLVSSGLAPYFEHMITSESAGVRKPHPRIFQFALRKTESMKKESIMIGDDLIADVGGAISSGWDCVFFNPKKQEHEAPVSYDIACLSELKAIL